MRFEATYDDDQFCPSFPALQKRALHHAASNVFPRLLTEKRVVVIKCYADMAGLHIVRDLLTSRARRFFHKLSCLLKFCSNEIIGGKPLCSSLDQGDAKLIFVRLGRAEPEESQVEDTV